MDFPDTLTITVTPEEVERGQRRAACDCPLSLAVQHRFEEFDSVVGPTTRTDQYSVTLYKDDDGDVEEFAEYRLTPEDTEKIVSFDKGGPFLLTEVTLTKVG